MIKLDWCYKKKFLGNVTRKFTIVKFVRYSKLRHLQIYVAPAKLKMFESKPISLKALSMIYRN